MLLMGVKMKSKERQKIKNRENWRERQRNYKSLSQEEQIKLCLEFSKDYMKKLDYVENRY